MMERWRPVVGFEGWYEVSELGEIRGLTRRLSSGSTWKAALVKQKASKKGHMHARLCRNGEQKWVLVHRVVLEAFVGPCPAGMECCHNNGIPSDNILSNLRWDTRKNNLLDRQEHGTLLLGEKNSLAKLTEADVREVLEMNKRGVKGYKIAEAMNVTAANISSILTGKTWKHVRAA